MTDMALSYGIDAVAPRRKVLRRHSLLRGDGRTRAAKRYAVLRQALAKEYPHGDAAAIDRLATLQLQHDVLTATLTRGEAISTTQLVRCGGAIARARKALAASARANAAAAAEAAAAANDPFAGRLVTE